MNDNENKTNAPLPELLPCPRCNGHIAISSDDHNNPKWWTADCDCLIKLGLMVEIGDETREGLVEKLNTRNEAAALREGKTVLITQDRDNLVRLAMLIEQRVGRSRSFDLFTNEELWKSVFESAEELLKLPDLVTERLRAEVEGYFRLYGKLEVGDESATNTPNPLTKIQ